MSDSDVLKREDASGTPERRTRRRERTTLRPRELPPEVVQRALDAANRVDKYVRVCRLGTGGMGTVWKAWDVELGRWVALKFLKQGDPEDRERFSREAQALARLSHPNIAAIYEVGEHAGQSYIAMQYVHGRTLSGWPRNDHRALVGLIRDAALALHEAHEQGMVHRDLKPANIMVEEGRSGGTTTRPASKTTALGTSSGAAADAPRVFLMDFGLAKETSVDVSISLSGTVVGTPAYMPPEQARGAATKVDRRSDVYALGATLYHVLTDRPPFQHADLYEVLRMVVEEEPIRARKLRPSIDRDLETIVMKCLEKRPTDRYQTAQALADELSLWLGGEPIASRPPTFTDRARKNLAKRKAMTLGALFGIVGVFIVLGFLLPALHESRRTLALQCRELALSNLKTLYALRRAGDLDEMVLQGARVRTLCDDLAKSEPRSAEPHLMLARVHAAELRTQDALDELQRALTKDPANVSARLESAILRLHLYKEALQARHRAWLRRTKSISVGSETAHAVDAATRSALERDPRDAEAAYALRQAREQAEEELKRFNTPVARGLAAWLRGDTESATSLLKQAAEESPDILESYEWLALIARERADTKTALVWYERGIQRDQGYLRFAWGQSEALQELGFRQCASGEDPRSPFQDAAQALNKLCRYPVRRQETYRRRAEALTKLATHEEERGHDPTRSFEAAVEDCDLALGYQADDIEAQAQRGIARHAWGSWIATRKGDASAIFASALTDLEAVIARAPERDDLWTRRAWIRHYMGARAREEQRDPQPFYSAAVSELSELIRRNPDRDTLWHRRAMVRRDWAHYLTTTGQDAAELLGQALADLDEALPRTNQRAEVHIDRATLHEIMARSLRGKREQAHACYQRAVVDCTHALEAKPAKVASVLTRRGRLYLLLAQGDAARGEDASPALSAAREDLRTALTHEPHSAEALSCLAKVEYVFVGAHLSAGREATCREAMLAANQALHVSPRDPEVLEIRGYLQYTMGTVARKHGADPTTQFASALKDLETSLTLHPAPSEKLKQAIAACQREIADRDNNP